MPARNSIGSAEFGFITNTTAGPNLPVEMLSATASTTLAVIDSTVARWPGGSSYKCVGGAAATSYVLAANAAASSTHGLFRVPFLINAYPTAEKKFFQAATPNSLGYATIDATGVVRIYNQGAPGAQVGIASDPVSLNEWHVLHLMNFVSATASSDKIAAYLDGVELVNITNDNSLTGSSFNLYAGWIEAPGQTATMWLDDLAMNTSGSSTLYVYGSSPSTNQEPNYPDGDGHLIRMQPRRVIANTGSAWHTNKTGSPTTEAEIIAALSNFPPLGTADTTTNGTSTFLRCGSATNPTQLDFETGSLGREGVPGHVWLDTLAGTYLALGSAASAERRSERFYLTGTVAYAELNMRTVGSPADDVVVEIFANSGTTPTGTALASVTVPAASLSGTAAWIRFSPIDLPLTVGTPYHLVVRRSGSVDASNYYEIQSATTSYYDGGRNVYNGGWGAIDQANHLGVRFYSSTGNSTIQFITAYAIDGEAIATGTKNVGVQMVSPSGTRVGETAGLDVGAQGTFPTNWSEMHTSFNGTGSRLPNGGAVPSMATSFQFRVDKIDATTRVACICLACLLVEFTPPPATWGLFNTTASGVDVWAKYAVHETIFEDSSGAQTTVSSNSWALTPDPLSDTDLPASYTVVDDATFRAGYTPL